MARTCTVTREAIERHERREGKSQDQFTPYDWQYLRSVCRVRKVTNEYEQSRQERKAIVLDPYDAMELMHTPPLGARPRKHRSKRMTTGRRRSLAEHGTCPVIKKRGGQVCGNSLKRGQYICGKHKLPTDVPYTPSM